MNYSGLVKFAGCLLLAGAGGGLIAQRITRKKFDEALKTITDEHKKELKSLKETIISGLQHYATDAINKAFTEVIHDDIRQHTENALTKMDICFVAKEAVAKKADEVCKDAKDELVAGARDDLMKAMSGLAKETVDTYVKEDMYKVNTRRIVEDAVYRMAPEMRKGFGGSGILDKFSGDDLRRILNDPWASDRLTEILKVTG